MNLPVTLERPPRIGTAKPIVEWLRSTFINGGRAVFSWLRAGTDANEAVRVATATIILRLTLIGCLPCHPRFPVWFGGMEEDIHESSRIAIVLRLFLQNLTKCLDFEAKSASYEEERSQRVGSAF